MRKVRSLLSVLLVCCLLVNVVPVKSKAVGATAAVVGVSAAMVAASALIGLGVSPGEDSSVFTGIVQNLVDGLETAGYVAANGLINVFSIGKGDFKYGISLSFLDFVNNWIWSNDFLTSNEPDLPENFNDTISSLISQSSNYATVYFFYDTYGAWKLIRSTNLLECKINSDFQSSHYGEWYFYSDATAEICTEYNLNWSKISPNNWYVSGPLVNYGSGYVFEVTSNSDLTLNSIGSNNLAIADTYIDWSVNSTTIPADEAGEDEDVIVYPIGLGPDYDNTISKPQEDVWAGTSEYEIEAEGDSEAGTGTETGLLSSILSAVKSIPSAFEGWFKDLIDLAGEIGEAIIGLPARIKEALTSLFQDVVNVGQAVVDAVLGIPQAIADVLTAIFVPDQAYVASKVDAVYAQFPFIQSIIATGEELKGAVSGSSGPPVIYVDLGLAPSGDFGQQKVLLTDFSWYEPYKQRVDTLLSAALWALFGWRMYLRLPSIISGEGGIMIASERAYRKLGDD